MAPTSSIGREKGAQKPSKRHLKNNIKKSMKNVHAGHVRAGPGVPFKKQFQNRSPGPDPGPGPQTSQAQVHKPACALEHSTSCCARWRILGSPPGGLFEKISKSDRDMFEKISTSTQQVRKKSSSDPRDNFLITSR